MRLLSFFLLFCFSGSAFAQSGSYRDYWKYAQIARDYQYGDFHIYDRDSMMHYWHKAFLAIPDKKNFSEFNYYRLIDLHIQQYDYKTAMEYLSAASCQHTKLYILNALKKQPHCYLLAQKFDSLYKPQCELQSNPVVSNKVYDSILRTSLKLDQMIRTDTGFTRQQIIAIDDSVSRNVRYCLKRFGFLPSTTRISADDDATIHFALIVMLIHTDDWHKWQEIDSILYDALQHGLYYPSEYAYSYDRARIASKLRPKYFHFIPGQDWYERYRPSKQETTAVNKARTDIGLPPYHYIDVLNTEHPEIGERNSFPVYFGLDKAELDSAQRAKLDALIATQYLKDSTKMRIVGYADKSGGSTLNQSLSQKRAEYVRSYLVAAGVQEQYILGCDGKGAIQGSDTDARNRRVDIKVERLYTFEALKALKANQAKPIKDILFIGGRHDVLPSSRQHLETLLRTMMLNPRLVIRIEGHICCETGLNNDGMDVATGRRNLSVMRAREVYDFLITNGINPMRLSYTGFGNSKPLVTPERTESDMQLNRRVEIRVVEE